MRRWKNLSDLQAEEWLGRSFDIAFNQIDILKNGVIAGDEMYGLIRRVNKG